MADHCNYCTLWTNASVVTQTQHCMMPQHTKAPVSKIVNVQKQIEAAGDSKAFLGHSVKQINHLFSYAVWVVVYMISGEPFVCLWPWCAEHHSMIVAPGRDFAAVRSLFTMLYYILSTVFILVTVLYSSCHRHLSVQTLVSSCGFPFGHSQFKLALHFTKRVHRAQYSVMSLKPHDGASPELFSPLAERGSRTSDRLCDSDAAVPFSGVVCYMAFCFINTPRT